MPGQFKITTLCYIINDKSEVLLAMKKRGFGAGKWNGPGGKVEVNENPKESAIREVKEEIGLTMIAPEELGCIEFIWPADQEDKNQLCYVYLTRQFVGDLQESDECLPKWFDLDQIPYHEMWDDDKYWYPEVLAGKKIKKRFFFDKDDKVLKWDDLN